MVDEEQFERFAIGFSREDNEEQASRARRFHRQFYVVRGGRG